jgi:hypothetical protein
MTDSHLTFAIFPYLHKQESIAHFTTAPKSDTLSTDLLRNGAEPCGSEAPYSCSTLQ